MEAQAQALLALGPKAVLLKGGHLPGRGLSGTCWQRQRGRRWLPGPRHDTRRTHGTGCTLSSALATLLGHKQALPQACIGAKAYVSGAIRHSDALSVGEGHGPTHHFHALKVTET